MTTTLRRGEQTPRKGGSAVLLSIVALVVGAILLVVEASDDRTPGTSGAAAPAARRTAPPWPPEYRGLARTIERLGFPAVGDESFHIHAQLSVYVNGAPVEVPGNIGIDVESRTMSPLHTHEPNGVIHLEADDPFPFRLAHAFSIWGVALESGRLGPFTDAGTRKVQVYANGTLLEDGPRYVLKDRDNIVVAFGEPGSFPTQPPVPGPPS